jgi:putative oxidoreductase
MIKAVKNFYLKLILAGESLKPILLLVIRLYWGLSFFYSGLGKLSGIGGTSDFFSELNIPFPIFSSYLVGYVEAICGLCLALGLASRLVALPLIFTMIAAYFFAHLPAVLHLFEKPEEFIAQSPFNFLLASLVIFTFGPGGISLDFLIRRFLIKMK